MATKKNPARDAALKEYVKRRGKVTMKTLSEKLNVSISQLGRWKKDDDWEGALKKKPGAPKGNKNAVGAGAPKKNKNAEKHGAYSTVKFTDLAPEQRAQVESFCERPLKGRLNEQLKDMLAQKVVLLERAQIYAPLVENGEVIELMIPDKKSVFNNGDKEFTTITSVSQFHRWIKIIEKSRISISQSTKCCKACLLSSVTNSGLTLMSASIVLNSRRCLEFRYR